MKKNLKDLENGLIDNKMRRQIKDIGNELLCSIYYPTSYKFDIEEVSPEKYVVTFQFEDCTEQYEDQPNKCFSSALIEQIDQTISILEKHGARTISINRYQGTNIVFIFEKEPSDLYDNIVVECPGVNEVTLSIGEEYYVGATKYFGELEGNENFKKRKLIKIEKGLNSYAFYFEGLSEPIMSLTRGHILSKNKILNRLDHVVIEKNLTNFVKKVILKCEMELGLGIEYDLVLYDLISRIVSIGKNDILNYMKEKV